MFGLRIRLNAQYFSYRANEAPVTRNRQLSPTWIYTGAASTVTLVDFMLNLIEHFSWSSVFVVVSVDPAEPAYYRGVEKSLREVVAKVTTSHWNFRQFDRRQGFDFGGILKDFNEISRGKILSRIAHHEGCYTVLRVLEALSLENTLLISN